MFCANSSRLNVLYITQNVGLFPSLSFAMRIDYNISKLYLSLLFQHICIVTMDLINDVPFKIFLGDLILEMGSNQPRDEKI